MKKTLIALTLAALPIAASADVILYGNIRAGVEMEQVKDSYPADADEAALTVKSKTSTQIADLGSYIGFKGHEKLGDNLNAIWQVENKVAVSGGGEWGGRDSFIGLEGSFGKIRAGKLSTQLKDMGNVDQWEYNSPALGLGVFTRTGERVASVRYDTPEFGGFSANVQYTPRDNANPNDALYHQEDSKAGIYAGLNYENSGFFAQYGFGAKANNLLDEKGYAKTGFAHRLEGGYNANNLFVGIGLQYTKNWDSAASYARAFLPSAAPAGADEIQAQYIGESLGFSEENAVAGAKSYGIKTGEVAATVAYTFGNVTPRISYAHGWAPKISDQKLEGLKYDQVVVGADYDFSKRTSALISAGWLKTGKSDYKSSITAGMVGLRHKF